MPRWTQTLRERFDAKWKPVPSGCWQWIAGHSPNGYGQIRVSDGKGNHPFTVAHRVSYQLYIGEIPAGLTIDHLCRNTFCVNPAHLEPVTHAENVRRAAAVRTTCPAGHPYDSMSGTSRRCLTCHRQQQAAHLKRKYGAA